MNLYDTYENEFELSVSTLRDMINEYKTVQNPKVVKQIDAEFDVAKDTIENMDIVIQSTSKKHLASKLEDHRRVLGRLESDWLELYQPADYNPWDKGSKLLDKTGRRLGVTMSIAAETEEIGLATLGRLHEDRSKLEGALDTMDDMGSDVTATRSILGNMSRRVITNKALLIVIIILLVIGIIVVVSVKWIRPLVLPFIPDTNSTTPTTPNTPSAPTPSS